MKTKKRPAAKARANKRPKINSAPRVTDAATSEYLAKFKELVQNHSFSKSEAPQVDYLIYIVPLLAQHDINVLYCNWGMASENPFPPSAYKAVSRKFGELLSEAVFSLVRPSQTILGLSPGASSSEVKTAFRRLAHAHHPDHGAPNGEAFIRIREAHDKEMEELKFLYGQS